MPSICVRHNEAYAPLGANGRTFGNGLEGRSPPALETHASDPPPPGSDKHTLRPRGASQPSSRRPPVSRVHHHLMHPMSSPSEEHTIRSQRSQTSSHARVMSPQSVSTVSQHPHGAEAGHIESALSVHAAQDTEDDFNHHDNIVEHLDVIDPQVATLATLTDTANAILIPPISFYSRKPTLVLPSHKRAAPPSKGDDTEKAAGRQYEDSLDQHVDDVLNSPSKFKRTMAGVWSFLKTPMGIITGIYGFAVVFWGTAIVVFLIKIINFHDSQKQGFWIEVSSQVVNGLFTVTGVGLIPFRVLDTYRISKITSYKRKTREKRAKAGLPPLFDIDDLPDEKFDPNYVHVLTEKQQMDLRRQQEKFSYSQTWYRPHGTETHRAFPINTALIICCLNDLNSIFQCILCGTMWGLDRYQRPAWSTGILIPLGFLSGIFAGIAIWHGGKTTKRTEKVEELLRRALETEPPLEGEDSTDSRVTTSNVDVSEKAGNSEPKPRPVDASSIIEEHMVVPQHNAAHQ